MKRSNSTCNSDDQKNHGVTTTFADASTNSTDTTKNVPMILSPSHSSVTAVGRSHSSCASIFEHYGQWLLSIPRDDIPTLMQTPEYALFQEAFQNLELAHRKTLLHHQHCHATKNTGNDNNNDDDHNPNCNSKSSILSHSSSYSSSISFLQHLALDDIILRIFEFLPCQTLVKTSQTCHRFHILCKKSAKQRTVHMAGHYYIQNEMKLLRANEQIEGIQSYTKPVVRVPLLGLSKRIYVSGSGDEEYNGFYFCTGSNGNGFLFTKPRDQREYDMEMNNMEIDVDDDTATTGIRNHTHRNNINRINHNRHAENNEHEFVNVHNNNNNQHHVLNQNHVIHHDAINGFDIILGIHDGGGHGHHNQNNNNDNTHHRNNRIINNNDRDLSNSDDDDDDGDETFPFSCRVYKKPRCIISKRFSNETILWYMSKEIVDENGKMKQIFSFWAKLMVIGEASADLCRYPSQTSILSRNGDPAWQSLSSNRNTTPPIVELID